MNSFEVIEDLGLIFEADSPQPVIDSSAFNFLVFIRGTFVNVFDSSPTIVERS